MKIVLFLAHTRPYGGERVAIELGRRFASRGHNVTYLSYYSDETVDVRDLLGDGVSYLSLARNGQSIASMALSVYRLHRTLRAVQPDVVVSFMSAANAMASIATAIPGARVPLMVTEHSMASVGLGRGWRRPQRAYALVLRLLYRRAAAIVAVSGPVGDDLARLTRLPPERIHVIPNPVDAKRVRARAKDDPPALPWSQPHRLLVCVAGLNYAKRPLLLLEVLRNLPGSYKLVMVGDGPLSEAVTSGVASLGLSERVLLAGWCDNPHVWMAAADALVLVSVVEGFGLVVAEAAALGVPAVTTGVGGLVETTTTAGGRVVQTDDPREIARAIVETVEQPPEVTFAREWEPEVAAARYESILLSIISGRGANSSRR